MYMMYVCMQDDGPLKITIYHVTWLPSRNKAFTYFTYLLTYLQDTDMFVRHNNLTGAEGSHMEHDSGC